MANCTKCGFTIGAPGFAYAGLVCRCWAHYAPQDPDRSGARETRQLTEADVRRIVREELAAAAMAAPTSAGG